jgi:hypothetical protein
MNRAEELERLEKELDFLQELNSVVHTRLEICKKDINNLIGKDEDESL